MSASSTGRNAAVPVRTIATAIGMLLITALALYILFEVRRTLVWLVIAIFFSVALYPVVNWVQHKVTEPRRALATFLVFLLVFGVVAGLITAFAVPLAREGTAFAGQLPDLIDDARAGRGPVGDLLERTNALEYVQNNQDKISGFVSGLTTPATGILAGLATGVAAAVTIFVLSFLMVLEGPKIVESGLNLLDPDRRERVRHVGHDCAKSITGYITGVLAIAAICGVSSYIVLKIAGVPFAGLIALFVALCDLIPLIGATLGAVVAVGFAFVESSTAGIIVLIFFFVYQQLENHLLQPMIQSRTVKVNALTVIISILIGVELMGILGALLAIPVASMIQVIVRDVWDHRRGQLKTEPTVGEDRTPVAESVAEEAAARPVAVGR
jgi:predicted PurR-regulated permease PerM